MGGANTDGASEETRKKKKNKPNKSGEEGVREREGGREGEYREEKGSNVIRFVVFV